MPGYRWRVVGAACDGALPDVKLMGGNIVLHYCCRELEVRVCDGPFWVVVGYRVTSNVRVEFCSPEEWTSAVVGR